MFSKFILVLLMTLSISISAKDVTEERLRQLVDNWDSLTPAGAYDFVPEKLDYQTVSDPDFQKKLEDAGKKINNLIDGELIELAGFMVPIEINGSDVSKFLLVPEAGQCIHVPPPPLNQTLLVDVSVSPTNLRDIYIPIIVSGKVLVESQSFDVANSGYKLTDVKINTLTYSDDVILE